MDLIMGQTDRYVEYNEMGQVVNNKKKDPTKSKYQERSRISHLVQPAPNDRLLYIVVKSIRRSDYSPKL